MSYSQVDVLPPVRSHYDRWNALYKGYADFYEVAQTQAMRDLVWSWVMDPIHEIEGLIALDSSNRVIGLAHFQPFTRPLAAKTAGYLHDLYVDPSARNSGAGRALIETVAKIGEARGWSLLRWMTRYNNARARGLYDQLATLSDFVTYDMAI